MPAKSKKQQRFFALVRACQEGKLKNPSKHLQQVADNISKEDAHHFAATKHEGLPEKAAEWLFMFKEAKIRGEVDPYGRYGMRRRAQKVLDKLMEPEDLEEERKKMEEELEEENENNAKMLDEGGKRLADALAVIREYLD